MQREATRVLSGRSARKTRRTSIQLPTFFTFTAKSGGGKDSSIKAVASVFPQIERLPSGTTRLPRNDDERNGKTNYRFTNDRRLDVMNAAGKVLWIAIPFKPTKPAAADQLVHRYFTLEDDVDKAIASGRQYFVDVEPDSLQKLRDYVGHARLCSFYIDLPEHILRSRLLERGDTSADEAERRIEANRWYDGWADQTDRLIRVNNSGQFDTTVENLVRHVRGHLKP